MKYLYLYSAIYIIIFCGYMIFFHFRNGAKSNHKKNRMIEIVYIERKYNINLSKVNYNKLCRNIALANSFVFTITLFIMSLFDSYILKVLLAFVSAFVLIIIAYGILALYYRDKEEE